jgi:hypothetical protein
MAKIKMSKEINRDRRRFFSTAAMTIAAAQLNMIGSADAQSSEAKSAQLLAVKPGTHTSFDPSDSAFFRFDRNTEYLGRVGRRKPTWHGHQVPPAGR